MTREELKAHCEKQIKGCEMWARYYGKKPGGKVYEEHKLILELLEQAPVLDKARAEMLEEMLSHSGTGEEVIQAYVDGLKKGLDIIDKYKAESEEVCSIGE